MIVPNPSNSSFRHFHFVMVGNVLSLLYQHENPKAAKNSGLLQYEFNGCKNWRPGSNLSFDLGKIVVFRKITKTY